MSKSFGPINKANALHLRETEKKLHERNVSANTTLTQERFIELNQRLSDEERMAILELGTYPNLRSLVSPKSKGLISASMTLVLCQVTNTDPLYLTGDKDENEGFTEETFKAFCDKKGTIVDDLSSMEEEPEPAIQKGTHAPAIAVSNDELISIAIQAVRQAGRGETFRKASDGDWLKLFDALLTKHKINPTKDSAGLVMLIKLLLS